ncbi:hypothetical protein [Fibrobacter sp. UWB10]|uniref:hypothetical protein n=1 Tax=Fibrobacter sp. UWB10 TaxID=1896201 RepID=UPI0024B6F546|nr:hypothetical protein [Fibrobacter sp. UWB10]
MKGNLNRVCKRPESKGRIATFRRILHEMLHRLGRDNGRIRMLAFQHPNAIKAVQVPPEHKNARRKHR